MVTATGIPGNLVDLLRDRAAADGERTALVFLSGDDARPRPVSYGELDQLARAVASRLAAEGAVPGDRTLLMYPPGPDYVAGFFGCLYAGLIAVPVYPADETHGSADLTGILTDSRAGFVLLDQPTGDRLRTRLAEFPALRPARLIVTGPAEVTGSESDQVAIAPRRPDIAFLQYTSGSTAAPKGVMVGHDNLLHNAAKAAAALGLTSDDTGVSWLPPYHDMGLIGGILQPIFSGFPAVLMSPAAFLRYPVRWLRAISDYRATGSLAPGFGYAECVRRITEAELAGLDLSSWRTALVGAEPVRLDTLDAFADRFGTAGFRRENFYPCYGLAEATLLVTGGRLAASRPARPGGGAIACAGAVLGTDEVLIVDQATRRRCPPGVTGEVWVSGPTVTHGYWRDDQETERGFRGRLAGGLADGDQRSFLCTGDLGFFEGPDLHLTGRLKELLIVRGRNFYPYDLELTAQAAHPALAAGRGAAFAVDDGTGEQAVLVLEVAASTTAAARADAIASVRACVAREHGLALADVVLVRRGTIPKTSSGKTRRLGCRDRYLRGGFGPPATAGTGNDQPAAARANPRVLAIVTRVLGRAPGEVDADRSLAAHGLDSVRAMELKSALAGELGLDLPLASLLGDTAIAALPGPPPGGGAPPPGSPAPCDRGPAVRPATYGQARLWLEDQRGRSEAYRIGAGIELSGQVDPAALAEALASLVRRHEALRTTLDADEDGTIWQTVHQELAFPVPVTERDTAGADRAQVLAGCYWSSLGQPFDLRHGPLIRAVLVRLAADDWVLLISVHHVAADGWSLSLLWHELGVLYPAIAAGRAAPLAEPEACRPGGPWPYLVPGDRPAGPAAAGFWSSYLGDSAAPELPADRPRSARTSNLAGSVPVVVPAELARALAAYARASDLTLFTVLLAGFCAWLAALTGQPDLRIGTFAGNREQPGSDRAVGFLARLLPVRIDTSGSPSFAALARQARDRCLAMLAHQDIPADEVLAAAAPGVVFALRGPGLAGWTLPGLAVRPLEIPPAETLADFSLQFHAGDGDGDGELAGWLTYAADRFERTTIDRLLAGLLGVLAAAIADPARPVGQLTAMSAAERRLVTRFSEPGGEYGDAACPVRLIRAQAARAPDRVAISGAGGELSYRDLDLRSDKLASYLLAANVGLDDVVGVCLTRSPELVVALLAILKAGAAYLPLDAGYQAAQLSYAVAQARPAIVLTRADLLGGRDGLACALAAAGRVLCLDQAEEEIGGQPDLIPCREAHPDALAYVIFTSGSTGRQKGAANTRRGLGNLLRWRSRRFPLSPSAGVLHRTALGFDVSVAEMLWPLAAGGRLVLPPAGGHRDPGAWPRLIRAEGVTDSFFVPSLLRVFLDQLDGEQCPLERVFCIGEELTPALVAATRLAMPGVAVFNTYGPAETAIEVTAQEVPAGPPGRQASGPGAAATVTIGRPLDGVRAYLLDGQGRPVPIGVAGELYLAGPCVGRGYLHSPALTSASFVADPFGPGTRMYRTGDLARWRPDGELDFAGRADYQVKVRGQRVELSGIEAVLTAHEKVRLAVVTVRASESGDQVLAAYLVARAEPAPASELRAFLRERLPEHEVPAAFVWVAGIPLNSSGKVDRAALPPVTAEHFGERPEYRPPVTLAERTLAGIWATLLELDQIGCDDNYRELGGHSLMAIRLAARVEAAFGVRFGVAELLDREWTLAELADDLQRRQLASVGQAELRAALAKIRAL